MKKKREKPCPWERARVSEQYTELQHLERTASERIKQGVEAAEARVTDAEAARDAAIAASAAAESVAKVARETQAGSCIQRLRVQRLCIQRSCVQRLCVQRSLLVYFTHVFRSTSAHAQPRQIRVRVFGLVVFSIRQTS